MHAGPDTPWSPTTALRTARVIAAAMIGGVTLFGILAWYIVQQQGPATAEEAGPLLYGWLGLAVVSLAACMVVWRSRVAPLIEAPGRSAGTGGAAGGARRAGTPHDPADRAAALQSGLIICWALVEAPAILGLVLYFLYGPALALAGGLLLIWLGIGLTWPKADWYGA